ncbi:MotB family protein [Mesorhizobium sp. CAU 1741]|uniref:MotB family protein n=1 Tax=Mesorhizobium sp. CAU 1741 TaxID=3140366 RepID=UPI00325BF2C3
MSAFDSDEKRQEIIIVRRGGDDHEEGHHGGVWKIAFADFMTALMCFFLVMWLVNAANEESKAAIASYFNPMTLADSAPTTKGLDDPEEESAEQSSSAPPSADQESDASHAQAGPGQFANSTDQADTEKTSDEHLFADPYAVLAEIAAQTATLQNVSAKGDGGAQTSGPATGADGGESYRDPFAPDFWSQEVAPAEDDAELDVFREPQPEPIAPEAVEVSEEPEQEMAALEPLPTPEIEVLEEDAPSATEVLAERIREDIAQAFGENSELNQTISVTPRAEGVLISLTDELNYGMFEVGSAVPQGELVLAMETIGRALDEVSGRISINGHTDGRPFRGENYDNWRLSTARAHAAYYMLVRGGVEEQRVREVAGFADRELKVPEDPLADANRRIEIFLEAGE